MADTADEGAAPLSAAELAAIAERIRGACADPDVVLGLEYARIPVADARRLLATIAARDATVAAYREIVAAVADVTDRGTVSQGDPDWWYCMFGYRYDCDDGMDEERVTHSPNCPWTKARALLAGEAGDTTAADMTAQAAEEEGNTTTPS